MNQKKVEPPNRLKSSTSASPKIELPKYCLYARKSSESDERQALSVEAQVNEMLLIAEREGLQVTETRRESHSAKDSGERPVFNQLIQDIRSGCFDGILTWSPDRLSRNAGDLGSLVDLMDQGRLKDIRTYGQRFSNTPSEKFLLMILCSQAKLENDNRGINVKRGLKVKASMGFRPGMPPLGYINDLYARKGEKKIYLDPERAPVIKEMFEKVAYHRYSGRDVFRWMLKKGLTTRNGKKVALSAIYSMLRHPYYCGKFEYPRGSGAWYEVGHESIIDEELFNTVQTELTVVPKCPPGTKEFDFLRLIKCGGCGSGVTAEEKFKHLKDGTIKRYVYYHCTRGADIDCDEPYINEEELIKQLLRLFDKLKIDEMGIKDKFAEEISRYRKFTEKILEQKIKSGLRVPKVNARSYAKYVLKEGNREARRELLSCMQHILYLKTGKIILG